MQLELESLAATLGDVGLVLCDRGVVDGAAYWPDGIDGLFASLGVRRADMVGRYAGVIHLRTPEVRGYDNSNPLRVETAFEAARFDARIFDAWDGHPRRVVVPSMSDFVGKLGAALDALRDFLPPCCRGHVESAR